MTNQPIPPQPMAWHDAYSTIEALWEESRTEHEEYDDTQLAEYRAELEKILEYLDEGMQNLDFPDD